MCALETAALDILTKSNGESAASAGNLSDSSSTTVDEVIIGAGVVTEETIQKTIDLLEDDLQRDFIRKCLQKDPSLRPTARELLFHPVLFEVHSLKLLAAHCLVNSPGSISDAISGEETLNYSADAVLATVRKGGEAAEYKLASVPLAMKLDKFMEDVK